MTNRPRGDIHLDRRPEEEAQTRTAPLPLRSGPGPGATATRTGFFVGGVLTVLGSLGYVATTVVHPDADPREAYSTTIGISACVLATLGLMVLCLSLVRWRSVLPEPVVLTVAAGLFFAGANAWFFASGIVGVAAHTTDAQFDRVGDSPWTLVMAAPKMVLGFVGFLSLAICGWRSRSIPRSSCALFAAAAPASLIAPFPPGALFSSIAFLVLAAGLPHSEARHGA